MPYLSILFILDIPHVSLLVLTFLFQIYLALNSLDLQASVIYFSTIPDSFYC